MEGLFNTARLVPADQALSWFDTPVFVLDVTGGSTRSYILSSYNKAFAKMSGLTDGRGKGQPLEELLPKRLAETLSRNYDQCVRDRSSLTYEELLDFSGEEKWWYTTLTPQIGPDGAVHQIFGLKRDITQQKTLSLTLAMELAEASALNAELRTLTAMAAHDIRGPLATLESLGELLLEDFQDHGDGKLDLLRANHEVITALRPQIEALLGRAMALEQQPPRCQPVDFGHMCADLAALIDPLGKKKITYPNTMLQTDPIALQLVLRNLLDNASRYAKSQIAVSVDLHDPTQPMVSVADDGPGLGTKTKTKPGLSGFGMAAVRQMVQSRGGSLSVIPNGALGGLTAQFTLPGDMALSA